MFILGHSSIYNSLECTYCDDGLTVTKYQFDIEGQTYYDYEQLITSTEHVGKTLNPLIIKFVLELHKGVNTELFALFMQQPTTKLCSKELDLKRSIQEIAATCAQGFYWYRLNQLERIVHSANNSPNKSSLSTLLQDIEQTVYSYLAESGRIIQFTHDRESFIFVVDSHYPKKDLYLVKECLIKFLKNRRGLKTTPTLLYWIATHSTERFTGTVNSITEKCYDEQSTALVTGHELTNTTRDSEDDSIPEGVAVLRDTAYN